PTRIVFGRMNLLGKIEQKLIIDLPGEAESEELNRILIENMERLEEMAKTKSPLVGIGIAVSGLVDQANSKVLYSPILAWDEFDFGPVGRHFNVPIVVENDANTFALAQVWTGMVPHHSSFLGVTVGV